MKTAKILTLTILSLLMLTGTALAGRATETAPIPFKGSLDGLHVSRIPVSPPIVRDRFEAEGQATLLGQFDVVVEATVDFGSRPVTGAGTYTFTAANGDQLVADQTGFSALVEPGVVLITETATIDPLRSTGRFAGAQGTFTVERLADAATGVGGRTVGTFEGTLVLPTGSR
jgi:hypothetical protein